jgi:hypothetical protein
MSCVILLVFVRSCKDRVGVLSPGFVDSSEPSAFGDLRITRSGYFDTP